MVALIFIFNPFCKQNIIAFSTKIKGKYQMPFLLPVSVTQDNVLQLEKDGLLSLVTLKTVDCINLKDFDSTVLTVLLAWQKKLQTDGQQISVQNVPEKLTVLKQLTRSREDILLQVNRVIEGFKNCFEGTSLSIHSQDVMSQIGSGSLPVERLPSSAICFSSTVICVIIANSNINKYTYQ